MNQSRSLPEKFLASNNLFGKKLKPKDLNIITLSAHKNKATLTVNSVETNRKVETIKWHWTNTHILAINKN